MKTVRLVNVDILDALPLKVTKDELNDPKYSEPFIAQKSSRDQ